MASLLMIPEVLLTDALERDLDRQCPCCLQLPDRGSAEGVLISLGSTDRTHENGSKGH